MNDSHCHFFSEQFFATLGRQRPPGSPQSAADIVAALGWDPPGSPEDLADRWVKELDRAGVARAALMASVPGDEESVARAVARHPSRIVGFFMLDPTAPDAPARTEHAFDRLGLRAVCLFPAMQRYSLHDPRVKEIVQIAAAHAGTAVFVHCGALSVGVRKKLGLPSRFDVRHGNPLDLHALAADHPGVPFIIPHFGAGLFREALLVADLAPNVYLDTSSTNRWMSYHHGLALAGRLQTGARSCRAGPRIVRHRLVVLSPRVEPGGLRRAGKRAGRRWRRRKGPPPNLHRQFRPAISHLKRP